MVRPLARTEAEPIGRFLVRAKHIKYVDDGTQTPPVEKEWTRYYIQWQRFPELVRDFKKNFWQRYENAQLAYAGVPTGHEPPWMKYYRFLVSLNSATNSSYSPVAGGPTAVQEGGAHATIANFTFSHNATGADILVVGATRDSFTDGFTATYNGDSLTEAKLQGGNRSAWIGYKGSPATGSNTCQVNFSTSNDAGYGIAVTYAGSAGTMSGGVGNTGSSTSTSGAGNTVTTTQGSMAFDVVCLGTAGTSPVVGGGQTSRLEGTDTYWHKALVSDEPATGTSTTMSWSWTTSANYAHASANIDTSSTIIYDSSGTCLNIINAGTTGSQAVNVGSSTDRVLWCAVKSDAGTGASDVVTALSYAGTSFVANKVVDRRLNTSTQRIALYYLVNPTSGSNTLSITMSSSGYCTVNWEVFAGCPSGTITVGSNTDSQDVASGTMTLSLTTQGDDAWLISGVRSTDAGLHTPGTGTTERQEADCSIGDSNSSKSPTGSYSMAWAANPSSVKIGGVMAHFYLNTGSTPTTTARKHTLLSLGVG